MAPAKAPSGRPRGRPPGRKNGQGKGGSRGAAAVTQSELGSIDGSGDTSMDLAGPSTPAATEQSSSGRPVRARRAPRSLYGNVFTGNSDDEPDASDGREQLSSTAAAASSSSSSKRLKGGAKGRGKGKDKSGGRRGRGDDEDPQEGAYDSSAEEGTSDDDGMSVVNSDEDFAGDATVRRRTHGKQKSKDDSNDHSVGSPSAPLKKRRGRPSGSSKQVAQLSGDDYEASLFVLPRAGVESGLINFTSSRSTYAKHDQRPLYLPGSSGGGLLHLPEPLVSMDQVGSAKVAHRVLSTRKAQEDHSVYSTDVWHSIRHHAMIDEAQAKGCATDWRWWPGKKVHSTGRALGLVPPAATVLDKNEARQFSPPQPALQAQPGTEDITSIADIVEATVKIDTPAGDFTFRVGPSGSLEDVPKVALAAGKSERLAVSDACAEVAETIFVNPGSYINSLDWAPAPSDAAPHPEYLAIATSLTSAPGQIPRRHLGARSDAPGAIQLWSLASGQCRLEYKICIPHGEVEQLQWSPCGYAPDAASEGTSSIVASPEASRLGILACIQSNRRLAVYAPPKPSQIATPSGDEPPRIQLEPLLSIGLPGSGLQPTCLDWGGPDILATGCVNGSVLVWHVSHLFERARSNGVKTALPRPTHCLEACDSSITSISFLQVPPRPPHNSDETSSDSSLGFDHDGLPHLLMVSSLDGSQKVLDINDTTTLHGEVTRQREPYYASDFIPFLSSWISERGSDNSVRLISARPDSYLRSTMIGSHDGRCLSVSASPFHPLVASGGADGAVKIFNVLHMLTKSGERIAEPVYRLDIHRTEGTLRFVERPKPEKITALNVRSRRAVGTGGVKVEGGGGAEGSDGEGEEGGTTSTAAQANSVWHPSVSVVKVKWCPNVQGPLLLASATAAGIVRIDNVASRWQSAAS